MLNTEYLAVNDDEFEYLKFIQEELSGTICHTTLKNETYEKILKDGKIRHSQEKLSNWYKNSFGFNNNCVCLFDFRNTKHHTQYLKNAITCFFPYYIFILKKEEYPNIIPVKSYAEISANQDTGYGVPYYECWYKGDLSLEKIEKVIIVKHKKNEFSLF